jgi:hypothetical protein
MTAIAVVAMEPPWIEDDVLRLLVQTLERNTLMMALKLLFGTSHLLSNTLVSFDRDETGNNGSCSQRSYSVYSILV